MKVVANVTVVLPGLATRGLNEMWLRDRVVRKFFARDLGQPMKFSPHLVF